MERFALPYPVTPHIVTRAWGIADPIYKAFGFERHNGVDIGLIEGQPIYAPIAVRVSKVGNEPQGSGLYVCLLSRVPYLFDDGRTARVELTFMHLSRTELRIGATLFPGTIVGYGGSTGRSTGPHTHLACKRVKILPFIGYRDIDRNDAGNTFDPEPYWTKTYVLP